jgi:1-acyl-sn-glycerol-3-phosphate acyltransferase
VNGSLSNALPKRWVLVGTSAIAALALGLDVIMSDFPLVWLALLAASTAVYSPTRYALLPAAAQDTQWPLPRINGWIEMGGAAGILVGIMTAELHDPRPLLIAATTIALLAALPACFASDVRRPEPPGRAVVDFFGDAHRILRSPHARLPLLVLAGFLGVLTAGSGVVITDAFDFNTGSWSASLFPRLMLVAGGAAIGALVGGWQKNLQRGLGFVPIGTAGLVAAFLWASSNPETAHISCLVMGIAGGLVSVPLRSCYQASIPADARGNGMAVSNTFNYLATAAVAGALALLVRLRVDTTLADQMMILMLVAVAATVFLTWFLKRSLLELIFETLLWPFYRIRVVGPGLQLFPLQGPVLVFANHAAWFDPLWIGKVLPRRAIPMMTSVFFDVPILHWLMVNVVRAIRVQASSFRREAPELQEAIGRLDHGEVVLIFPEGMMRRRDDQLLRQFGQGIWRMLQARPTIPVVACWIEGGWGSYASYKDGLPTKNKKIDWWWPVRISMQAPQVLDPVLLENHRATRLALMRACLEARKFLGLEVPEPQVLETSADDTE